VFLVLLVLDESRSDIGAAVDSRAEKVPRSDTVVSEATEGSGGDVVSYDVVLK
jgi:hypothetical protein